MTTPTQQTQTGIPPGAASTTSLSFRPAVPSEAAHLATLINQAFRNERTGQTWLFDDQARRVDIVATETIANIISGHDTVMLVCIDGSGAVGPGPDGIIACCSLRAPSSPPPSHMTPGAAWLALLAVDPVRQSRGLGRAMLAQGEGYAHRVWSAERVELDAVNMRSELREWYRRCKYMETGAARAFEYGASGREVLSPGLEMVVMKKELGRIQG